MSNSAFLLLRWFMSSKCCRIRTAIASASQDQLAQYLVTEDFSFGLWEPLSQVDALPTPRMWPVFDHVHVRTALSPKVPTSPWILLHYSSEILLPAFLSSW